MDKKGYAQAVDRIKSADNILLVTHLKPDGDALGSLCAMIEWLESMGKTYTAYCAGPMPSTLSFLPHYFSIITDKSKLTMSAYDLIISLDCGSLARTALAEEISNRSPDQFFLEIDHHPQVEKVSDLAIRQTEAASTTEILYNLIQTAEVSLTPVLAKCLLTGILTDTGNFTFSATTERTIAAASALLLRGANLFKIVDRTWRTKTLPDLRLWGYALSRLTVNHRYSLAYTVITADDIKQCECDEEALTGLAGFLSSLPDVAAIMLLSEEEPGVIRGNLRTIRDDVNVAQLARRLGGGGHPKAAGFSVAGRLVQTEKGWKVET